MEKLNRELLESVIKDRLTKTLEDAGSHPTAFEEAIKAIDKQNDVDKFNHEMEKLKHQMEMDKEKLKHEIEMLKNKFDHEVEMDKDKLEHEVDKHLINVDKFKHETEMDKDKFKHETEMDKEKLEHEKTKSMNELKKEKRDRIMKVVEIGAIVIAAPLIEAGCKKAFAEILCNFEKDYTFTTTAGRSLSSLFRFK